MTATVPTTTAPCPSWCVQRPGHGLPLPDGGVSRMHLGAPVSVPGDVLEAEQHELVSADGVSRLGPRRVVGHAGPVPAGVVLAGVAG